MPEWTVVTVIIALVGLGAAIVKPIVGLTKAITKLTVTVESLDDRLDTLSEKTAKALDALFHTQREHQKQLDIHERRIGTLETKSDV